MHFLSSYQKFFPELTREAFQLSELRNMHVCRLILIKICADAYFYELLTFDRRNDKLVLEVRGVLNRKLFSFLSSWKQTKGEKCLIIRGARQVGKTFAVRQFGFSEYESLVELNFIEQPELITIFDGNLDSDSIRTNIRLYLPEAQFVDGKTLLFLDEIQDCPNAITALKFLAMDHRMDVIASGSLLGMNYTRTTSYPEGYVEYYDLHALSFEEFLWASQVDPSLICKLRECFDHRIPVPLPIHEKMLQYIRQYLVIGGMPEVVNRWVETQDYYQVDLAQRRLYQDYLLDIARYADPNIKIKAEKCFRSIPMQLLKENHKFQYSTVEKKGTSRKFESSLDWIINANMASMIKNISRVDYPLEACAIDDNIRVYHTDIGFMISTFDYSLKKTLLEEISFESFTHSGPVISSAKGPIYEALVADMLIKNNHHDLYFYRNDQGTVEMEFLIQTGDGIVPIEVKAGRNKSKSLNTLLKKDSVSYGYKLAFQNIGQTENKITLPVYMAMFI